MKITSKDGKFFVFDATESLLLNILRNLFTLSILAFCIYISRGSAWWTFVSGLMFIVGIFSCLFGMALLQLCDFATIDTAGVGVARTVYAGQCQADAECVQQRFIRR